MAPPVIWFDRLDSTNAYLHAELEAGRRVEDRTVVAAHCQTQGKGRRGRAWIAPAGENITASLYREFCSDRQQIVSLPLVMGLGVCRGLENLGICPQLKWPNDLLLDQKKLCGILAECVSVDQGVLGVILGVGANVNLTAAQTKNIDQPATSLRIATGREWSVPAVLAAMMRGANEALDEWQTGGFAAILPQWLSRSADMGRPITVTDTGRLAVSGTFAGLGETGQLLLTQPDHTVREVWSGDVGMG
jgi:BirA family biotin operon repressor/biotin-[acetyl-CoA-carboxylase] ligase